jgi:glycosyltransferase involved in cell wall biosynthesis
LLTTRPASFAGRSGYPLLAEYMPEAEVVVTARQDPTGWGRRMCARAARRLAFSRWYLGGSAAMEWKGMRRLRASARRLVHVFWGEFDLGFLDLYTRWAALPLCATFHHCADTIGSVIRFPRRLRRLDAVILMSRSQQLFMLESGVPEDRIHVIHHGVDIRHFTPGTVAPADGPFRILSVGGYRRDFPALRAICDRLAGVPGVEVQVIGPSAAASEFVGLSHVVYRSGLSDEQLLREYQSASCFLLSVENATANNALLEAMACGLPIVGTDVGGVAEYVPEGAGILVPPHRPDDVVGALKRLRADPDRCAGMRAQARARAEELDWATVAKRTRAVYAAVHTARGLTG